MRLLYSVLFAFLIGCSGVDRDMRDWYELSRLNTMSHVQRLEDAESRTWWTALAVGLVAFGCGATAWRRK